MSVITPALDAVRRIVGAIGSLLPVSPSVAAPPPDLDGRRPHELDPADLRRMDRARKEGKGGYR